MRFVGRARLSIAVAVSLAGCAQGPFDDPSSGLLPDEDENIGVVDAPLYVDNPSGAVAWSTKYLRYCFDARAGNSIPSAADAALIRRAVENSWTRYSGLTLVDVGVCPANFTGIRVHVQNGASAPANYNDPMPPGCGGWGWPCATHQNIVLTTTFNHPGLVATCDPTVVGAAARNRCLVGTTTHEFGHALGFAHDHRRPDSACLGFPDSNQGGGKALSSGDDNSVMSGCVAFWPANLGNLTATDIFGVQRAYGRNAPGSIVAFDGRCLDISGGAAVNGNLAQTWDCLGGTQFSQANQNWYWTPSNGKIGLCSFPRVLDIAAASGADGANVQAFDMLANGAVSQTWSMPQAQIQSLGGLCLDIPGYSVTNGEQVQLWGCSGDTFIHANDSAWGTPGSLNTWRGPVSENQQFTLEPDGHIRLTGTFYTSSGRNKCLEVQGGAQANGTPVVIADCANVSSQKFALAAAGTIKAFGGSGNVCVEAGISNLDTFNGGWGQYKLQVWSCNGAINQQFNMFGQIRAMGDRCLDVAGWGRANGTKVWSWTCNPVSNMSTKQAWQFYW